MPEPSAAPEQQRSASGDAKSQLPSVSLPKGGGAIHGIGEKFAANPVTGTGSMSIPLGASPGRSDFGPKLALSYDSGSGNGPFGFGWSLSIPSITRKTDKGLPRYFDAAESDVFVLSGAEDLVPVLKPDHTRFEDTTTVPGFTIHRYRPRVEGLFARIERFTADVDGRVYWRSISRDNVTTWYGETDKSQIADPNAPERVFSWLACRTDDDKGNAMLYTYARESEDGIDGSLANERNRSRSANHYLKRIEYGNTVSHLDSAFASTTWLFELVFDYEDGHYENVAPTPGIPESEQHSMVLASASPVPGGWPVRPDPFSSYRSGFEVRTYRRCQRVLMFHNFAELGQTPCLVRSTDFDYADLPQMDTAPIKDELAHEGSTRFASFIQSVTQSGFVRDVSIPAIKRNEIDYYTYLKKSLPAIEFKYTRARIQDDVRELDSESLENLPEGIDGKTYQWVDLDGEGLSGVLVAQRGGWYYKPNLGDGRFGAVQTILTTPSLSSAPGGRQQFLDLAGDGQLDLVAFSGPTPGFYERTSEGEWEPFRSFAALPSITWEEPNMRFADLDGDGHADVLITEQDALVWYPSLGEGGFGPAQRATHSIDDERGVRLVFADGTQSVYLADMSGDGLVDVVRVRNGEVCYWPNLGYGRFGSKVTMDNAPLFDTPDQFDQRRVRLADIDGSGTNDIIYIGRNEIGLFFNQSGNRWSEARRLTSFRDASSLSSVMTADLFGNGTACLVWSSPLPGDAGRQVSYIDLMGGQKPHLLKRITNNLGAETELEYASSTRFYLEDKQNGRPWVTRLPFPVHVVERVRTFDHVARNRFVTRYAYHHGYFDGVEREFRGFGLVEQWGTEQFDALENAAQAPPAENINQVTHVPPVWTRTWFHTGVYVGRDHVSDFFAGFGGANDGSGYYREPELSDQEARERLLDDTVLPDDLTEDEAREACRALKGSMLRQEVYALDGTAKEQHPYSVTEQNFAVRKMQGREQNRHAVFLSHPKEAISYHYERSLVPVVNGVIVDTATASGNPAVRWLADPRVAHNLTLEVDDFGNMLKSAAVGYGRCFADSALPDDADRAAQKRTLVTYTEAAFTNEIDLGDSHRNPAPAEARTYELTGFPATGQADRFQASDFVEPDPANAAKLVYVPSSDIDYSARPTAGKERRLIEHARTLYRRDNLSGPLALSGLEGRGLPHETYKLAFTQALVDDVYGGRVTAAMLQESGYVHSQGDGQWWIPSGRVFYSPDSAHDAAAELGYATQHFFLAHRYRDPFYTAAVSTEAFIAYDGYDLLLSESRDALGNRVTVGQRNPDPTQPLVRHGQNYRVLQPELAMDPNRNRTEVAFDALGMVVGTAVRGKPEENPVPGDELRPQFKNDLTQAEIELFVADPRGAPAATLLDRATTRIVYDLSGYPRAAAPEEKPPVFAATLARETHAREPAPAGGLRIQVSFSYSDGFGREIQKKIPAEPGRVPKRDAAGIIVLGANGVPELAAGDVTRWVSNGWTIFNNKNKPVRRYEPFFTDLHAFEFGVRVGVSPIVFYDPLDRVVATLHPNHTWEKVLFDPWRQETWDVADTLLTADPKTDSDVGDYFGRLPDDKYLPTWLSRRQGSALGAEEEDAARKAAVHANTPTVAHADSLGRASLTVAHNKFRYSDPPGAVPTEEFYKTRVITDIEGNQREVHDARGRIVMRYDYDMLGNRIHQQSMEAGERWTLGDVAGKPLLAWDSRGHVFLTEYDPLRRPVRSRVTGADPSQPAASLLTERRVYGEQHPDAESRNVRGRLYLQIDQSGAVTAEASDFKGNPLRASRRIAKEYTRSFGWGSVDAAAPPVATTKLNLAALETALAPLLEAETFTSSTTYDALNRPVELTTPRAARMKPNRIRLGYNEANLLERVDVNLRDERDSGGALKWTTFVADIDYDAKGQREFIKYGNGVSTTYEYDPKTFRLVHLKTTRDADTYPGDCPPGAPNGWPGCDAQNLYYTYDPVGNITHIRDDAQQTIYFQNKRVEPSADYTYDATYRLIEATGREHLGQAGGSPIPHSYNDGPRWGRDWSANDGNAMGRYLERYVYDDVGNFASMKHVGSDPANPGWTRAYTYDETSLLEDGNNGTTRKSSNRLTTTTVGTNNAVTETYTYDEHGNMFGMQQLQVMQWNYKDQLQMSQRQAVNPSDTDGAQRSGERTWYVYDSAGQRVRKVTVGAGGQLKDDRLYLGGFEIYRREGINSLVRETLQVMDDKQRIALVDTRTGGNAPVAPGGPDTLIRYQCGNHLGSASLEFGDQGQTISYEEYSPYGSTTYEAVENQTHPPKRYRYTGKERDEESGLYYHGARYYAPWLARWTACDPHLFDYLQLSPYAYAIDNPLAVVDPTGADVVVIFRGGVEGEGNALPPDEAGTAGQLDQRLKQIAGDEGIELNSIIIEPSVTSESAIQTALDFINEQLGEGERLIIYGYSRGGDTAVDLAQALNVQNTRVDLLFTVDAAYGPLSTWYVSPVDREIPGNVDVNINYYQTEPSGPSALTAAGRKVGVGSSERGGSSDSDSGTLDVWGSRGAPNVPLTDETRVYNKMISGVEHDNIDEAVQNRVIRQAHDFLASGERGSQWQPSQTPGQLTPREPGLLERTQQAVGQFIYELERDIIWRAYPSAYPFMYPR